MNLLLECSIGHQQHGDHIIAFYVHLGCNDGPAQSWGKLYGESMLALAGSSFAQWGWSVLFADWPGHYCRWSMILKCGRWVLLQTIVDQIGSPLLKYSYFPWQSHPQEFNSCRTYYNKYCVSVLLFIYLSIIIPVDIYKSLENQTCTAHLTMNSSKQKIYNLCLPRTSRLHRTKMRVELTTPPYHNHPCNDHSQWPRQVVTAQFPPWWEGAMLPQWILKNCVVIICFAWESFRR